MLQGLKRVQKQQGGGDREGPIMVLESQVRIVRLISSPLFNLSYEFLLLNLDIVYFICLLRGNKPRSYVFLLSCLLIHQSMDQIKTNNL